VSNLDDERFENYLKRFRPAMPEPLLVNERWPAPRRHLVLAIWAVSAVAMVILGAASLRILNHRILNQRIAVDSDRSGSVQSPGPTPPLTMHDANALLATAPSYKAVMNKLAFPLRSSTVPKDKQSALAVLGKEKIKL
jgi:hypothetical protein